MASKKILFLLWIVAFMVNLQAQTNDMNLKKRQTYLQHLLKLLPPERPERGRVSPLDATWKDWLRRTGELPPDFDTLPSLPFLPDPLVLDEGGKNIPITTMKQWQAKRQWMRKEIQHWITGVFPPPPDNMRVEILHEKMDSNVLLRLVELQFGPQHRAKLTIELMIPPGEGPFPVFMTQWNHRGWAQIAVRRGYIGCVYAGADAKDDTEAYADIWYPQYDFTRLMRRAWGAYRAIDYLTTLPIVDKAKIALTGHSRNGKQSLMAAAFDERIQAVITSSGGTGAEDPFRYTSDKFDNETIAEITTNFPHWLHPRLRFFIGREHKLPVDQNLLMALVAPRGLMLCSAITEHQGNPWGIEQAYRSAQRVYRFLGAEKKCAIWLRRGRHGTAARDIEIYIDFFDFVFGRSNMKPRCALFYDDTFEKWKSRSGEKINPLEYDKKLFEDLFLDANGEKINSKADWEKKKNGIQKNILWILGEEPPGVTSHGPQTFANRRRIDDYLGDVISRPKSTKNVGRMVIGPYHSFGDYLYGNLYYPVETSGNMKNEKFPVVIFLHEYAYPTGFARRIQPFFEGLVERGFAVFAFDMIGFGTRIEEGTYFYERYPHWSKMGKMVADVRAAVDALVQLDFVDADNIYAVGYALGSTVGLYAAALDERIVAIATVCGFSPMRTGIPAQGIEGIRAYSHLHGLLPRLGFFLGHEIRLPVDFPEILACIAPRSLLVIAPKLNRDAIFADIHTCMSQVVGVYELYNSRENLCFQSPIDYNRFSEAMQEQLMEWFAALCK